MSSEGPPLGGRWGVAAMDACPGVHTCPVNRALVAVCAILLGLVLSSGVTDAVLAQEAAGEPTAVVGEIVLEGAVFDLPPDIAQEIQAYVEFFRGRRSTASELYALSQIFESLYQEAGYFLARVTIPPQEIEDGGVLRMLVVDGYLEGVNLDGVPARSRRYLEKVFAPIINRSQLTADEFERVMTLARQAPGVSVRTTLVPGEGVGAGVLVVEGEETPLRVSLTLNSRLPNRSSPWNASASVQLFQPFGRGEQLSFNVSGLTSSLLPPYGTREAAHRSGGGSIRWPVGAGGQTLQLSFSTSYTFTPSPLRWLIPDVRSDFRRISLEYSDPVQLSQTNEVRLSATLESTDEVMSAPDFDVELYRDGLRVLRFSANASRQMSTGARLSGSVELSQGLAWGSRGAKDVEETKVPFSRPDAGPGFAKLGVTAQYSRALGSGYEFTANLRGQLALVKPLPTSELFGLTGGRALPSLEYGVGANDHGWSVRGQVDRGFWLLGGRMNLTIFGYVAAGGTSGDVADADGVAQGAGVGLRGQMGPLGLTLEQSWGWSQWVTSRSLQASVEVVF